MLRLVVADDQEGALKAMLQRAALAIDSRDEAGARTAAWQVRAVVEHLSTAVLRDAGRLA